MSLKPVVRFTAFWFLFWASTNWLFPSQHSPESLKDIYKTGKIQFKKELQISRDSFPEDVFVKMMGDFEVWNNNVYIADPLLFDIKIFDISGKYRKKFGQKGAGPSDLYRPLHLCHSGDKLIVWENINSRFSSFSPDGTFIGNTRIKRNTGPVRKIRALNDGRLIVERNLSGNIKGEFIQYAGLEMYSRELEFIKIIYKKQVAGNMHIEKPQQANTLRPFAPGMCWDVLPGNRIVIGFSGEYKLEIVNPAAGVTKTVSHKFKPVRISELDRKTFFDGIFSGREGRVTKGASKFTRQNAKFPSHKPAFKGIVSDFEGNILVFLYKETDEGKPGYIAGYFDAFDSSGNFINQVEIVSPKWLSIINICSRRNNLFWLNEAAEDFDPVVAAYLAKYCEKQ